MVGKVKRIADCVEIRCFENKGWAELLDGVLYLTNEGKSWADKIAQDLFV